MKAIGEPITIAQALNNLALAYDLLGDISEARLLHTQALTIRRRINDRHGIAYSLTNLAALAEIEGNYDTARRWLQEALTILRSLGEKMAVASALGQLGKVALKTGDYASAEQYAQESLALRRELNDVDSIAASLTDLGQVAHARGDQDGARNYYQEALQTAKDAALEKRAVSILVAVARLQKDVGEFDDALELLLVAQQFYLSRHTPTDEFDPLIVELRAQLPAEVTGDIERRVESASIESIVNKILEGG
jgi:tetratricopeptide (TPR) repeat protein